jgi:two-component system cell cycle sensor histidine kinase/response regulator CckA
MNGKKPTYAELEARLAEAEEALRAIRSGEVDLVLGEDHPLVLRAKGVQEELEKSREQLEMALSGSNAGLWDLRFDPNAPHQIPDEIYLSPRLKGFIGFRDDEFPNSVSAWQGRILPEDLEVLRRSAQEHLEGRREIHEAEYRIRHRDGSIRWIHTRGKIHRDDHDVPIRWSGIDWDITERKRMEQEMASLQEQLRQAQKMEAIGRLAGGIAHDFNNALTVIRGNCQLSLLDLHEADPLYGNLKEIEQSVERAARLTQQLLAFSRKQIMQMKVVDPNALIEDLQKILRRILGEDIELTTFLEEGVGKVRVDPGQMEQAVINLAVNARDAMPRGGKLTIETANVELDEAYARDHVAVTPGPYVMLSVSDTGVGMSPEVRERAFEPFFTTKEAGKGTGLGLSMVYGIVKQSGGNIWVYSEMGKGTTFKIYLPRVEGPVEERREETLEDIPQGSETILVVEDEEVVRKLAVRLLRKQGYKVLEASDGGKAFMLCEQYDERIDLILSDVVLPGMDGRRVVERLQKIHPEAKALYMSGYTDNVIAHHGMLEQGIHFIQKPFTVGSLARKVREVIDGKDEKQ